MKSNKQTELNEQGFAAIVIAVVLVLVLSLITLGFAELMRHEQRSALDKQLSSQAYYAAESGVNDAVKAISAGYDKVKDDCAPLASAKDPGDSYLLSNDVGADTDTNVKYSCLLIDPAPKSLEFGSVDTEQSKGVELTSADASDPIRTIVVSWQDAGSGTTFRPGAGSAFPPISQWGATTGILRVGLTPLVPGSISRDALATNTFAAFLYPNSGSGSPISYGYSNDTGGGTGAIINGRCNLNNTPRYCSVAITGLNQRTYFLNMRSIYRSAHVTVQAYGGNGVVSTANLLSVKNAQTLIDSTGKAQDVLKRIQVRVPSRNSYTHPDYTIESAGSVCKQLQVYPGFGLRGGPAGCR
jgi:hypothetical protein